MCTRLTLNYHRCDSSRQLLKSLLVGVLLDLLGLSLLLLKGSGSGLLAQESTENSVTDGVGRVHATIWAGDGALALGKGAGWGALDTLDSGLRVWAKWLKRLLDHLEGGKSIAWSADLSPHVGASAVGGMTTAGNTVISHLTQKKWCGKNGSARYRYLHICSITIKLSNDAFCPSAVVW